MRAWFLFNSRRIPDAPFLFSLNKSSFLNKMGYEILPMQYATIVKWKDYITRLTLFTKHYILLYIYFTFYLLNKFIEFCLTLEKRKILLVNSK